MINPLWHFLVRVFWDKSSWKERVHVSVMYACMTLFAGLGPYGRTFKNGEILISKPQIWHVFTQSRTVWHPWPLIWHSGDRKLPQDIPSRRTIMIHGWKFMLQGPMCVVSMPKSGHRNPDWILYLSCSSLHMQQDVHVKHTAAEGSS